MRRQFVGATVVITLQCYVGHENTGCSSAQHLDKDGTVVFYNNIICAASCLFSGNAHGKISQMMSFMGMNWISNSSFYRIQAAYLVPAIDHFWQDHQAEVLYQLQGKELIVYGDGRCDSPGSSAKYSTYTIMEDNSNCILSTLTVMKSEVSMNIYVYITVMLTLCHQCCDAFSYIQVNYQSPNMERMALRKPWSF